MSRERSPYHAQLLAAAETAVQVGAATVHDLARILYDRWYAPAAPEPAPPVGAAHEVPGDPLVQGPRAARGCAVADREPLVRHARPEQRQILDVFTCLKHHCTLATAGRLLARNHERHLKSPAEMAQFFADRGQSGFRNAQLAE